MQDRSRMIRRSFPASWLFIMIIILHYVARVANFPSTAPVRCLSGWRRHGRSCFRALAARAGFDEARGMCHALDPAADLTVLAGRGDGPPSLFTFVRSLPPAATGRQADRRPLSLFLGATDRGREGEFRWHSGAPAEIDSGLWAPREPSNTTAQNCLMLIRHASPRQDSAAGRARTGGPPEGVVHFSVGDTRCDAIPSVVVCQMPFPVLALPARTTGENLSKTVEADTDLSLSPAAPAAGQPALRGCDHPGAVRFLSSCYLYQDEYLSRAEAAARCRERGFLLAGVQSDAENAFIQSLILDVSWLGGRLVRVTGRSPLTTRRAQDPLSDRGSERSDWRWEDGQPLSYSRWTRPGPYFRGQPDGDGSCVNMLSAVRTGWVGARQRAGHGFWADNDCRVRWPSVCETPAVRQRTGSDRTTGTVLRL